MVIFLQFSVSSNVISILATHMSLFTDLFPSKVGRLEWLVKLSFFKIFKKMSIFKFAYFYRLSNTNKFYYCFILDITFSLVPDIERVSIWFRLDSMSIFVSIVKQTISFLTMYLLCFHGNQFL